MTDIVTTSASFESLGAVLDYLSKKDFFRDAALGDMCNSVKHQLATGSNFTIIEKGNIVGYFGYIFISADNGEKWIKNEEKLHPLPRDISTAAALTAVAGDSRKLVLQGIRACRDEAPGTRIFYRRISKFSDLPDPKRTVKNCSF